ncbi:MAG: hypothetical protein IKW13_01775 [Thermoguttaceae bacterium]|nr:hypothetical protein [Thermoguttaceae bacterium]
MGNLGKICVLLTALSVGAAGGAYAFYKKAYQKPRAEIAQQKAQLGAYIETCKKNAENFDRTAANYASTYALSMPTNRQSASVEYQIWLDQMLEFCNLTEPLTKAGRYVSNRATQTATQEFSVQAQASTADLTQFLFEFYWTPFLHRITALDLKPIESSDLLDVRMTIETMTVGYKERRDPTAATNETEKATAETLAKFANYPKTDKLPLETTPTRVLASGPLAAYEPFAEAQFFRAVRAGIDSADHARLTGTPEVSDEKGRVNRFSRWRVETEDRTITLKEGDRMQIGSVDAEVVKIEADIVVLRQDDDRLWVVLHGGKLSEAVAVPANLY